jgi:hypothetical protein
MNELSPFAKVSYLEYFYYMKHLQGTDRAQLEMITRCLDDTLPRGGVCRYGFGLYGAF